jgi:hypothetical protein
MVLTYFTMEAQITRKFTETFSVLAQHFCSFPSDSLQN